MSILRTLVLLGVSFVVVLGSCPAQRTLLLPAAAASRDLDSESGEPFGSIVSNRVLYILDSSHFTGAGINEPVQLLRMRFRVDSSVARLVTAASNPNTSIWLSTSPRDYLAISTTRSINHGADRTLVWSGTALHIPGQTTAGARGHFYLDFPFPAPFLYTPANGDLAIEIWTDVNIAEPHQPMDMSTVAGEAKGKRIIKNFFGNYVITAGETCPAVEFTYRRLGLFPWFEATPVSGRAPLLVNFTNWTTSSAPGGVTSWAWDFQNDGIVDSTAENPTYSFPGACRDFDVRLTATDALHGTQSVLRSDFIRTGAVVVDAHFTWQPGPTPMSLRFSDDSCAYFNEVMCLSYVNGPWEWDFNGDGITDSTDRYPTWTFSVGCDRALVSLKAWQDGCWGIFSTNVLPGRRLELTTSSPSSLLGRQVFLDLEVTAPGGVFLCGIGSKATVYNPLYCNPLFGQEQCRWDLRVDVYLTDDTWVSREQSASRWRWVGRCSETVTNPGGFRNGAYNHSTPRRLESWFGGGRGPYLPAGRYGLALYFDAGYAYMGADPPNQGSTQDLRVSIGGSSDGLFSGAFHANGWDGNLRYCLAGTDTDSAGVQQRGIGCAGPLGIPQLTATSTGPRIGFTFQVTCNRLPANIGAMATGFSGTMSSLGPLPFLLPYTTTCWLRNSLDIVEGITGSGGTANWSLGIPMSTALIGVPLFHQAVVPSPGTNLLDLVLSDALGSVLGR